MKSLDPWQMPHTGTSLIEASAGTGKTYTLTTLYLRLLVEENLRPAEILVVTYTKAATAELRDRIRERIEEALAATTNDAHGQGSADDALELDPALVALAERAALCPGGDPLRRALIEFDEAAIFTIHGFCQRTLQENAFESEQEQEPVLHNTGSRTIAATPFEINKYSSTSKKTNYSPETVGFH